MQWIFMFLSSKPERIPSKAWPKLFPIVCEVDFLFLRLPDPVFLRLSDHFLIIHGINFSKVNHSHGKPVHHRCAVVIAKLLPKFLRIRIIRTIV